MAQALPTAPRRPHAHAGTALLRSGNLALAGVLTSLTVAMPSAVRLSDDGLSLGPVWFAVGAVLCVPIAAAIALLRSARPVLKELSSPIAGARGVTLLVWVAVAFPLNRALAVFLAVHTHHRGLGGAAFGAGSIAIGAGAAIFAWRVGRALARKWRGGQQREEEGFERPHAAGARTNAAAWASLAVAVLWIASQGLGDRPGTPGDSSAEGMATAAELGWGLIALAAATLIETNLGWERFPSIAWTIAFGVFVACGAVELRASSQMREAVTAEAPLASSILAALGVGTGQNPPMLTAPGR